ncbi:MAG: O-antigen ligase [Phycisphaerae bacterium]|jgi:O-antigen ligase
MNHAPPADLSTRSEIAAAPGADSNESGAVQPPAVKPLHVVMIVLAALILIGSSLLLSAAESYILIDGALEWREESPLRAVVKLLCLDYQFPTVYAGTVKNYILGMGAGLAVLCVTVAIGVGRRNGNAGDNEETGAAQTTGAAQAEGAVDPEPASPPRTTHIAPLIAAQVLAGLFLLWSFASSRWSSAPELAVGASLLLTIQFLWAFGLGNGLGPRAVHIVCRLVVVVTVVTAAVAIWYFYGRNPNLRAKFPYGNPTFLAACLIPGILLAVTTVCGAVVRFRKAGGGGHLGVAAAAVAALAVISWAMVLSGSRSAAVGLAFGLLGLLFFSLRGWRRALPVVLAVALSLGGWVYFLGASEAFSPTGRHFTLRLRTYAWSYAWQMFREKPITGHGQGGFVLAGDSYASEDVLDDPLVLETRIAHVHNEWLEIMADLGLVGFLLIAGAMVFTFRAGMVTLNSSPDTDTRWALCGLLGALIGLIVEESFGVGLRVSGVPTMFFSVVGLIWAASALGTRGLVHHLSQTRARRLTASVVGGVVGLMTLATIQQDVRAARQSFERDVAFFEGDYDRAVELASNAPNQLNPQRALTDLYRLSEAHLRRAQHFQDRARDRRRRAYESDVPDQRLAALAEEDYQNSEIACQQSGHALNALLERAPGFLNHGRLEYRLYRIMAGNAAAREDHATEAALIRNAAEAIKRELVRQPFEPAIAVYYGRVARYAAGADTDLKDVLHVLARPLRHSRLTESYMELLKRMASDPDFDAQLGPIVDEMQRALRSPSDDKPTAPELRRWAPEVLRLAAAVDFTRGDYQKALARLELAAPAYDDLAGSAAIGAASCFAELAICRFFADPLDPDAALASAERAVALTPESLAGRQMRHAIQDRMIDYHLAADRETEAKALLMEAAPAGVGEEDVLHELGVRYRRMCEAMLGRREADGMLRKAPADLLPKLRGWIGRSLALNPDDALAHFAAADLAFHAGNDRATVNQLELALQDGLPREDAARFVSLALGKMPESKPLQALWAELTSTSTSSPDGGSE